MSHPDDELLSALLDGEAPPGDVAHVDGCEQCSQRVGELRYATQVVAATVPVPPGHLREASLAVALRTLDEPVRRLPVRRFNGLSAAAVLLVALAVGGLLVTQLGRAGTDRTADDASVAAGLGTSGGAADRSSSEAALSSGDAAAGGSNDMSLSAPAESTFAAAAPTDLGAVDDIAVVSQRSTDDLAGRDATTEATIATDTLVCPPDAANEPVIWQATLTYEGTPAVATVRTHSASTRITEIRARSGCAVLATQEFEPTSPR